jgi:hypothetical protein
MLRMSWQDLKCFSNTLKCCVVLKKSMNISMDMYHVDWIKPRDQIILQFLLENATFSLPCCSLHLKQRQDCICHRPKPGGSVPIHGLISNKIAFMSKSTELLIIKKIFLKQRRQAPQSKFDPQLPHLAHLSPP